MRARVFLACALLASCSNKASDHPSGGSDVSASGLPTTPDVVKGTLSIDGAPVTEMTCKPGAAVHIFVEVVTPKGTLHVEDGKLAFDGEPLTCEKFDRSWGGGRRPNNDAHPTGAGSSLAYWRGTLSFACVRGTQHIAGDLELDCGGITADERASLDANRKQTLDQQKL
ncbi:MAG TPA: hypothetical protein VGM39_09065 [Kofleriaceae bacterium]|jgi:hypothetical protein